MAYRIAVAGLTLTEICGSRFTVAEAETAGSAWLVAVTVTVRGALIVAGAVYSPFELTVP